MQSLTATAQPVPQHKRRKLGHEKPLGDGENEEEKGVDKADDVDKADEDHVDGQSDGDVEASDDEDAHEDGKYAAIRLPKMSIGLCVTRSV
jgi:hypothetical protein